MDNTYDAVEFYSCLLFIMDHYGFKHQVLQKLPEELAELLEALDEYEKNPDPDNWSQVLEEAADTFIMLEQFQMLISKKDKAMFDDNCMSKVHREIKRIERRKNNETTKK